MRKKKNIKKSNMHMIELRNKLPLIIGPEKRTNSFIFFASTKLSTFARINGVIAFIF